MQAYLTVDDDGWFVLAAAGVGAAVLAVSVAAATRMPEQIRALLDVRMEVGGGAQGMRRPWAPL